MSNSNINHFKRLNSQRFGLCECTLSQLNRDQSTELCFDSDFRPAERKKLSVSGTLRNKKHMSIKKKHRKNKEAKEREAHQEHHQKENE
jgi:hypothetical protein